MSTPHAVRPIKAGASETEAVDVEDMALVQLRCASGALGTLDISRMATGATNDAWFEVRGDKGALRFTLEEPNWLHVFDTRRRLSARGFTRVETVARYDGAFVPDWTQPVGISRTHAECQYQFLRSIWEGRAQLARRQRWLARASDHRCSLSLCCESERWEKHE